jgi:hypothetical protein
MKRILLIILTALLMVAVAACAKKPAKDPNAVLTDSDVPLDLGAQIPDNSTEIAPVQ